MHWYDWFLYTSPCLVHSSCRQTCRARGHVAHADSGRVAHEGAEMESENGSQLEFQTDYADLRRKHQGDIKNGLRARFKCYQRHPMTENERRRLSDDVPLPLCSGVFRCTHYRHGETRIKSENRARAVRRNCERLSPKRGNMSTSPRAIFLKPRS